MRLAKIYFCLISFLIIHPLIGQERCATVEYNQELNIVTQGIYQITSFEKWMQNKIRERKSSSVLNQIQGEQVYTIPVVIHVIHNNESVGFGSNISESQINSQIEVLNEDYRRLNFDTINTPEIFKPMAADIRIEFKLAERDPNGEETNGILRVAGTQNEWNATSSQDNQELKSLSFWPPEDYLNLWVTTIANDYLGYAQYPITELPGSVPPFDRETDGVVIHYRAFGSILKGNFPHLYSNFNRGRTTTHEIGHFFGLRHIWGDIIGCGGTDYCDDTPDAEDFHYSCSNIDPFTCGSEDMYQNYLDYSYDACMNIFTIDQSERMRIVLENSPRRKSLLTSKGILPPDDYDIAMEIRDIISPANINCEAELFPAIVVQNIGNTEISSFDILLTLEQNEYIINYTDYIIPPGNSSLLELSDEIGTWLLDPGQYYFKVGIRNPNGVDSINLENFDKEKYFLSDGTQDVAPSIERFTDLDFSNSLWSVYNPDNDLTWTLENTPVDNQNNIAASINMYNYDSLGAEDWLISPVLDMSMAPDANITFNYSYSLGDSNGDILALRVSTDCGESFPYIAFSAQGSEIETGSANGEWKPFMSSEWKKGYVDLGNFAGMQDVRIAFVTTNLNGNNLFLDDLETYVTGFTKDISLSDNSLLVHPNPSTGSQFYVSVQTEERQQVTFQVIDMNGKTVYSKYFDNVLNQTFEFDLAGHSRGIYIIRATGDTFNQVERFYLDR